MSIPTIFDLCTPRDDVLKGAITEGDFAADLAQVIRGAGPEELRKSDLFFADTYPMRGLQEPARQCLLPDPSPPVHRALGRASRR